MRKLTISRFLLLLLSIYVISFAFDGSQKRVAANKANEHQQQNDDNGKQWHLKATTDQKEAIVNAILSPPLFEELHRSENKKSSEKLPFLAYLFGGKQQEEHHSKTHSFRLSLSQKEAVFSGVVQSLFAWAGEDPGRRMEAEDLLQNAVDFDQVLRILFDQDFKPVEHWTQKTGLPVDKALESVQSEAFQHEQLQHAVDVLVKELREMNARVRVPLMKLIRAVLRGRLPEGWDAHRKEAMARELYAQVLQDAVGKFKWTSKSQREEDRLFHRAFRGSQQAHLYASIARQTPEMLNMLCIPQVEAVLRRDGLNEIRGDEDFDKASEVIRKESMNFFHLSEQLRNEVFDWAIEHSSLKDQNKRPIPFSATLLQAFFMRIQEIGGARGEAIAKELADELLLGKKEKLAEKFAQKLQQKQGHRNYRFSDYAGISAIVEDFIELFDVSIAQRAQIRQRFGSEDVGELVEVFLAQKTPEDRERLFTELLTIQQGDPALFREYVHSRRQKNTAPEEIGALQALARTDLPHSGLHPGEAARLKFAVFRQLFPADGKADKEEEISPPVEAACQALTLVSPKLREKILYPKEEIDGRSRSHSKLTRQLNDYRVAEIVEIEALFVVSAARMFRGDFAPNASPGKFLENAKKLFTALDASLECFNNPSNIYAQQSQFGEWFASLRNLELEGNAALGATKRFLVQLMEGNNWREKHNLGVSQYLGDFNSGIPGRAGVSSLLWMLPDDDQKLRKSVFNKIAHILKKNPKLRVDEFDELLRKLPYGLCPAQIQAALEGKLHSENASEAARAFLLKRELPGWDKDTAMAVLSDIEGVLSGWYRQLTPYSVKENDRLIESTAEFSPELLGRFRAMTGKQRSDVFRALKTLKDKNGRRKAGSVLDKAHQHCHQQALENNEKGGGVGSGKNSRGSSEAPGKIISVQAQLKEWDNQVGGVFGGGLFTWIRGETGGQKQKQQQHSTSDSSGLSSPGHHQSYYPECLMERLNTTE